MGSMLLMGAGGRGAAAAPSGPGEHRYWRIYSAGLEGVNTRYGATEIELRATASGADETGSGTASALNAGAGAASQAFDNNLGTDWATNSGQTIGWIKYDFGLGNDIEIREVSYRGVATAGRGPYTDAVIAWSDDDSAWTTAFEIPQASWTSSETRVWTF